MNPKTYALMLAVLVALPAMATAQTDERNTAASFALRAERDAMEAKPGSTVVFVIHAASREAQTISLVASEASPNLTATLGAETLTIGPDHNATLRLAIAVSEKAGREKAPISLFATNPAGERQAMRLYVAIHADDAPRPTSDHAEKRRITFALKADPESQRIEPGGTARFAIHVRSYPNSTVDLAVDGIRGEGYAAELVGGVLYVKARENASPYATVRVVGTNAEGETHDTTVKVSLVKQAEPKPEPAPARGIRIVLYVDGEKPVTYHLDKLPRGQGRAWLLLEMGGDPVSLRPATDG